MDGFKEVVFDSAQRVVADGYVALFKPNEPRTVNDTLYRAAMAMGGKNPTKAEHVPKEVPKVPVTKVRRRRKKTPTPWQQTPEVVAFIEEHQSEWDHDHDYDIDGVPRILLFKEKFPHIDTVARDTAWAIYVDSTR